MWPSPAPKSRTFEDAVIRLRTMRSMTSFVARWDADGSVVLESTVGEVIKSASGVEY
jgi:hypothetical protein